jgi:hypothetical protein
MFLSSDIPLFLPAVRLFVCSFSGINRDTSDDARQCWGLGVQNPNILTLPKKDNMRTGWNVASKKERERKTQKMESHRRLEDGKRTADFVDRP